MRRVGDIALDVDHGIIGALVVGGVGLDDLGDLAQPFSMETVDRVALEGARIDAIALQMLAHREAGRGPGEVRIGARSGGHGTRQGIAYSLRRNSPTDIKPT